MQVSLCVISLPPYHTKSYFDIAPHPQYPRDLSHDSWMAPKLLTYHNVAKTRYQGSTNIIPDCNEKEPVQRSPKPTKRNTGAKNMANQLCEVWYILKIAGEFFKFVSIILLLNGNMSHRYDISDLIMLPPSIYEDSCTHMCSTFS